MYIETTDENVALLQKRSLSCVLPRHAQRSAIVHWIQFYKPLSDYRCSSGVTIWKSSHCAQLAFHFGADLAAARSLFFAD